MQIFFDTKAVNFEFQIAYILSFSFYIDRLLILLNFSQEVFSFSFSLRIFRRTSIRVVQEPGEAAVEMAFLLVLWRPCFFRTCLTAPLPLMIRIVQLFLILALSFVFEFIPFPGCSYCVVAGLSGS